LGGLPLVSISSIFYEQLLLPQIPKAQKNSQAFFALLGSASIKALSKMLVKLTPGEKKLHCQNA
jgi:hypothetical protein